MKIRGKLVSMVGVAVLVPLCFSILSIRQFGKASYQRQTLVLYRTIAQELANGLNGSIQREYRHVLEWVGSGSLFAAFEPIAPPELDMGEVDRIETQWQAGSATADREPFRTIYHGEVAQVLQQFRRATPHCSEMMVTDRFGRLVGATNPTTDYWQADEEWWQTASRLPAGTGELQHVGYDASAGALVIDVIVPLFAPSGEGELLGILKASLNAENLVLAAAPQPWDREIVRDICFADGRVLTRIRAGDAPPVTGLPPASGFGALQLTKEMSGVCELYPGTVSLCVGVRIPFVSAEPGHDTGACMDGELYVVVHRPRESAMAPLANVIWQLSWLGGLSAVIFAVISYMMGSVWFAAPLLVLRRTALSIAEHIQQSERGELVEARLSLQQATRDLKELQAVSSGDELQDLAGDFARMGARVLTFNRELERELTEKTEEINSDLAMAREFQEALLPQSYPDLPPAADREHYALHFDHIYRPAVSVSGDFFDITKVSDHCVRVFIADVMGHGARSALMTAVLHALIHSVEKDAVAPGDLLQRMNDEFLAIGRKTQETIFVTAVHMIIDTSRGRIRYACAGHPSPLLVDHASGDIVPLKVDSEQNPAVGLLQEAVYTNVEMPVEGDISLLLYTDGVTEAMNPQREEFGYDRLLATVASAHREGELEHLPRYVLENLETYMDIAPAMDDICLVSIDLTR